MTHTHDARGLDRLDAEYRQRRSRVWADEDLTPEAQRRKVRELQKEYDQARESAEKAVRGRLEADAESAYRCAYGPERSYGSAQQEAAKELGLARIRSEVTDEFEAGRQDPLVSYQHALRAGDKERAEVIGKLGGRYLKDAPRRARLRELVAENEPAERRRAKEKLAELENEQRSFGLASGLRRRLRNNERSRS